MQNFTLLDVAVAEISVTEHIHRITADLMSDKWHTSIAFVDKTGIAFVDNKRGPLITVPHPLSCRGEVTVC